MPLPTARFAILVAVPALVLLIWSGEDWRMLWIVEGLLLAVFAADTVRAVAPSRIAVAREHPDSVTLGDVATLTWVIENHDRRAARVTVTDALWPSLRATRGDVTIRLDGSARHAATSELWPSRRGRFALNDITIRVAGPLRLATRHRTRDVPTVVRVLPAFPSRDEIQRRMRQPRLIDVGIRTLRAPGGGTDFDQLRELRPGDDSRRIDWAATARTQRPVVRQYRAERNQTVVMLLDNGRIMAGQVGVATAFADRDAAAVGASAWDAELEDDRVSAAVGVPRVEHAMDAVLALTRIAVHVGDRVGLVTFDREVRTVVPAGQSRAQHSRVAEAMYQLEPQLSESAYTAAFTSAAARFRRRSLYVVLTDLVESAVEQAILPALPILSRRHLVVVAAVQDPVVQQWAAGGHAAAASDAFRQAAAVTVVQQRRRCSARLEAAGAVVIDAEPGRLAMRLVDTYLELKASGRL